MTTSTPVHEITRLIEWRADGSARWHGRIGPDAAGRIELDDTGYVLRDWQCDELGTYRSLEDAQLALEPEQRARVRLAAADRRRRDFSLVSWALIVASTVTVGGVLGSLLLH
jgi:hypothetical protein